MFLRAKAKVVHVNADWLKSEMLPTTRHIVGNSYSSFFRRLVNPAGSRVPARQYHEKVR